MCYAAVVHDVQCYPRQDEVTGRATTQVGMYGCRGYGSVVVCTQLVAVA